MPLDTSTEAERIHRALIASWPPEKRLRRTFEMCEGAFELMRVGIRTRHPEYSVREVELARCRLSWGDDLFRRAYPDEPLLAP